MKWTQAAIIFAFAVAAAFFGKLHNQEAETYKIGSFGPGGGIVFFVSEEGFEVQESDSAGPVVCHYLECLPVELKNITWCPCGAESPCDINTADGAGAGKLNTSRIVSFAHSDALTSVNCAAYVCSRYFTETTKPGDWYLPSKEELDLIYKNLVKSGIINK